MAYNPPQFGTDEAPTSGKFNRIKEGMDWLHQRLPFVVGATCNPLPNLAAYMIDAHIFPGNAEGTGAYGLTWERVSGGEGTGYIIVRFKIPSAVFSGTPRVVGLTVGAESYPWLVVAARYSESATGFHQRFGMTDGGQTAFGAGPFNVNGLLIGTRKSEPS